MVVWPIVGRSQSDASVASCLMRALLPLAESLRSLKLLLKEGMDRGMDRQTVGRLQHDDTVDDDTVDKVAKIRLMKGDHLMKLISEMQIAPDDLQKR